MADPAALTPPWPALAPDAGDPDAPVAAAAPGALPQRRCIVTGQVAPMARLIRFVVSPAGSVVCDVAGRLPGRGLWVGADRATLAEAVRRNTFRRAAKGPVTVAADLVDSVEALLLGRVLDHLGLARRAGQAVFGFERVREWVTRGEARLLFAAGDGDPRDRARLRRAAADRPVIEVLSGDELGRATGRPRTVHGAVAAGRLAGALLDDTGRLAGLRPAGHGAGHDVSDRSAGKWRT